jgi:hypothetical protein
MEFLVVVVASQRAPTPLSAGIPQLIEDRHKANTLPGSAEEKMVIDNDAVRFRKGPKTHN